MTCWLEAGLAFGDEGKGCTTEAIVRETEADLVVRYNGGAQAAHNVVLADGRHHTFSQFGSGTFVPGVRTYLSQHVLINPVSMMLEEEVLRGKKVTDAFSRTRIDSRAFVITPFQRAINRLEEMCRGENRIGSTGMGIGVTRQMSLEYGQSMLTVGDLLNSKIANEKLKYVQEICYARAMTMDFSFLGSNANQELEIIVSDTTIPWYLKKYKEFISSGVQIMEGPPKLNFDTVFEGAQGMLLDEKHGFQPHTTWTDITFANAYSVIEEAEYAGEIKKVGVLRAYFTRHGAGPFPSEDNSLLKWDCVQEEHNKAEFYTGAFRVGNFDIPLVAYALHCIGGVNMLAINHLDVADKLGIIKVRLSNDDTIDIKAANLVPTIEEITAIPVVIEGHGPTYEDKVISLGLHQKNLTVQ